VASKIGHSSVLFFILDVCVTRLPLLFIDYMVIVYTGKEGVSKMNSPVGLGIIGCGSRHFIRSHIPAVQKMPDAYSIVAAHDIHVAGLKPLVDSSSELHIPDLYIASSVQELLEFPGIDAVFIAVPDRLHLEMIELCMAEGKHILCEKPLWDNFEDNSRGIGAIQKAAEQGLVLTSCHPRRFAPEFQEIQSYLRFSDDYERNYIKSSEKFGSLHANHSYGLLMEINFRFFYHKPTNERDTHRSLMLDHINHEVDLMSMLFGPECAYELHLNTDGAEAYHVTGHMTSGTIGFTPVTFSGSRCLEERVYVHELDLIFQTGRVRMRSGLKDGIVQARIRGSGYGDVDFEYRDCQYPCYGYPYAKVFEDIMQNFACAIRGEEPNYLTPEDLILNTVCGTTLYATGEFKHQ
jgi:predicted dehydrogenase